MEKLNRVLRCLDACYVDDCGNCDYCGNGCSEVLMKDALDVINGLRLRCSRLEAERDFAAGLAQAYRDFVEATLEKEAKDGTV